jgi:hypothetical protein
MIDATSDLCSRFGSSSSFPATTTGCCSAGEKLRTRCAPAATLLTTRGPKLALSTSDGVGAPAIAPFWSASNTADADAAAAAGVALGRTVSCDDRSWTPLCALRAGGRGWDARS